MVGNIYIVERKKTLQILLIRGTTEIMTLRIYI